MRAKDDRGFSLVELMMVVMIFGMILAFAIPNFRNYRRSSSLSGAKQNIVGELRLARERAIATRVQQEIRFIAGFQSSDYHIWNGVTANPKWSLPPGVTYHWGAGTQASYRMAPDGRCIDSGMVILEDEKGNRDTVSVLASGMILGK